MRNLIASLLIALAFCSTAIAQEKKQDTLPEGKAAIPEVSGKSLTEKSSYLLGYNFLAEFKALEVEIDMEKMLAGMKDALEDKKPPMSEAEIAAVDQAFEKLLMTKRQEAFKKAADKNLREGEAFLKENALKDGVKQLESGLQYKVVQAGTGESPKPTDKVKINFVGKFIDGTQFESNGNQPYETRPANFPMRGLAEALPRMKVGGKWIVYLPSKLALGIRGNPPMIGPNQVLVYELELVTIVK